MSNTLQLNTLKPGDRLHLVGDEDFDVVVLIAQAGDAPLGIMVEKEPQDCTPVQLIGSLSFWMDPSCTPPFAAGVLEDRGRLVYIDMGDANATCTPVVKEISTWEIMGNA